MKRLVMIVVVVGLFYPCSTSAQERPIEIAAGLAGLAITTTGGDMFLSFNGVNGFGVLVGIPAGERISVEPIVDFNFTGGAGVSLLVANLGVGLPVHFGSNGIRDGFFVRPGAGVQIVSADARGSRESVSQFAIGLDVGTKIPVLERLAVRVQGGIAYAFENDTVLDAFEVRGIVLLSFFTR